MITLSYSTIAMIKKASHNWLNKQMGIERPYRDYFERGKEAHAIIQAHVSRKQEDERLKHITHIFPIVEQKDFDERCAFLLDIDGNYRVRGFVDGRNDEEKVILEIKTGTSWNLAKYAESPQRKIYGLAHPGFTHATLILAPNHLKEWSKKTIKAYKIPFTEKDKEDAMVYIQEGITIIESGDFTGGLTDGKCLDTNCDYGWNCQFK